MVNQMKTYVGAFFVTALLILGGCTTVSEAGYYWGDYAGLRLRRRAPLSTCI